MPIEIAANSPHRKTQGALTSLDLRARTAKIVVALQLTVTPARIRDRQAEPPGRPAHQDVGQLEARCAKPGPGRGRSQLGRDGLRLT